MKHCRFTFKTFNFVYTDGNESVIFPLFCDIRRLFLFESSKSSVIGRHSLRYRQLKFYYLYIGRKILPYSDLLQNALTKNEKKRKKNHRQARNW